MRPARPGLGRDGPARVGAEFHAPEYRRRQREPAGHVVQHAGAGDGPRVRGGARARTRLLDLKDVDLPLYRPNHAPDTDGYRRTVEAVGWADAFVLATPDYHGSMSGAMKNFLDYFWSEFAGKLFGYVCASHEKGLTAMEQMRTVVRQCYGWSLPYGVAVNGHDEFDEGGELKKPAVAGRLKMLGRDLAVYGELLRGQFNRDVASGEGETFAARYSTHE